MTARTKLQKAPARLPSLNRVTAHDKVYIPTIIAEMIPARYISSVFPDEGA